MVDSQALTDQSSHIRMNIEEKGVEELMVCPICGKDFPLDAIVDHSSKCRKFHVTESANSLKPLSKPIYHLLSTAQIRAKLVDLKLKTNGDRSVCLVSCA